MFVQATIECALRLRDNVVNNPYQINLLSSLIIWIEMKCHVFENIPESLNGNYRIQSNLIAFWLSRQRPTEIHVKLKESPFTYVPKF